MFNFKYLLIFIVLFSCIQKKNNNTNFKNKSHSLQKEFVDSLEVINDLKDKSLTKNNSIMISKTSLKKLDRLTAIQQYGEPSNSDVFMLNEDQNEFRIGLLNIYSTSEIEKGLIIIYELTWEKDENTWITVWYEKNKDNDIDKPVDYLEWNKGNLY